MPSFFTSRQAACDGRRVGVGVAAVDRALAGARVVALRADALIERRRRVVRAQVLARAIAGRQRRQQGLDVEYAFTHAATPV